MKMNNMKQKLITTLKNLNEEQWEDLNDAYGSFKPEFYIKMGFPEEFVQKCVETFESDGTYAGSLWKDPDKALVLLSKIQRVPKGKPLPKEYEKEFTELYIPKIDSVLSLSFLRRLAHAVNVEYEGCMGRGREARYIVTALQKSLGLKLTCDF
jgi:hypothetical protein